MDGTKLIIALLAIALFFVYLYGRSDATVDFVKNKAEEISKSEKKRKIIDGKFETRALNDLCVDVGGLHAQCWQ